MMPSTFWTREDNGSANNPALNMTGADAIQITFIAETDTGSPGDLFLDQPIGGGVDPDTQVSIDGTSYSFTYELTGTMPTANSDGAKQVPTQFQDSTVVIITVQDYPTLGDMTRLSFLPDENATQMEMDDFGNGAIDVQGVNATPPAAPVCFVKGTLIDTPNGAVAIEALRVGDLVNTLDHGTQPIRWIGSSRFQAKGNFAPIRIAKGALGNKRDLLVSPQHRMLLTDWRLELLFADNEVLVTAQSLVNDHTIRPVKGGTVTYYHLLFDAHEIVFAEGIPSESLLPGDAALDALSPASRAKIHELFPSLQNGYGPAARLSLKNYEGIMAARQLTCGC